MFSIIYCLLEKKGGIQLYASKCLTTGFPGIKGPSLQHWVIFGCKYSHCDQFQATHLMFLGVESGRDAQ